MVAEAELERTFNEEDILNALTKATNHVEVEPKQKHVDTLIAACAGSQPDVHAQFIADWLVKQLHSTKEWLIATKTLMTIHLIMKSDSRAFFKAVLAIEVARNQVGSILKTPADFMDNSGSKAMECSKWLVDYAGYVNKRKELYRKLRYDPDATDPKFQLDLNSLDDHTLVQVLPILKNCMHRLILAAPKGYKSQHNGVVQAAVLVMLRESDALYKAFMTGMSRLVSHFFQLDRADAFDALSLFKECLIMHDVLEKYYHNMDEIDNIHGFAHPVLQKPPTDMLPKMEEYVSAAC